MLKLAKAGNEKDTDTELGNGQTTRSFTVNHGIAVFSLVGNFSAQTVTLQMSPGGMNGNFATYVAKDTSGVPASATYTDDCSDCVYGHGQTFRFVCSAGGSPDIDIFVSGDGVILN